MQEFFDASSYYPRYDFMAQCPESLIEDLVPHPVGDLKDRVLGIRRWRDALVAGQLPPEDGWPPKYLAAGIRQALSSLSIHRFTKDQPDLVDFLLRDVLKIIAQQGAKHEHEFAVQLAELERQHREETRSGTQGAPLKEKSQGEAVAVRQDQEDLSARAHSIVLARWMDRETKADTELLACWQDRVHAWSELYSVFGDLGELLGRGSNLATGVLRHVGWKDVVQLHKMLARLPQLREVIEVLGRLENSRDKESAAEIILEPVRRLEEELREVRTPFIPAETRGLTRSGDIPRMLPGEAVKFGHPMLRMLWHAARAEHGLLTYRVEGVEVERFMIEREVMEPTEKQATKHRQKRGPIVAVVDTSGSMYGTPEVVAKALVLAAARVAHAEKRQCLLFAFSGPGEVIEKELSLSESGLAELLNFLALSFGGGTDADGVLARVINRLNEDTWQKADVLMVSDGEWSSSSHRVQAVKTARERGTRFHGVQIGSSGMWGLNAVCDHLYHFTDWISLRECRISGCRS